MLQSLLGVVFTFAGVFVMYIYITSINTGANMLFLAGAILLIGAGVFLLVKAGKSDRTVVADMPPIKPLEAETAEDRLAKNNELMGEWKKTNETKDRLRMLEIQASAESDK